MTAEINWTAQECAMPMLDYQRIEQWICAVAGTYGRRAHRLTYVFCSDERILEVNRRFLNHDYYTDIITFDDCVGSLLRGDIFISLDTVRSNAEGLNQAYVRELLRVIIHGILHLCGINDKGPGEREIMEAAENKALDLWENLEN